MSKHTSGPWNCGYGNQVFTGPHPDPRNTCLAQCYASDGKPNGTQVELDESFANARVMAASPDLLEAAWVAYRLLADVGHEWAGRHTPDGQMILINLRDAIAKATGEDAQTIQDDASVPS